MDELAQTLDKLIAKARSLVAENKSLKKQISSTKDDRDIIKQLMSENSDLQQRLNHYELVYGSSEKIEAKTLSKNEVTNNQNKIKEWLNSALFEVNGITYVTYPEGYSKSESESIIQYFLKLSINGINIFEKIDAKHIISNYSIAQICSFL